ncbi:MAG: hypothetical protein RLP15_00950 [Cryomorphaceae bacterium]
MKRWITYALIPTFGLFVGCEGFFGKKTDLEFIDAPQFQARDVAYVPVQPIIEGFIEPTDVVAGFDELIYVVDRGTEEIISFDQSGRELGRLTIKGVAKLVQDRQLNILAIASVDSVINDVSYTLSAIHRIDLNASGMYGIQYGEIVHTIVHPFYFKTSFSSLDAEVEFTSIDIMGDNSFYVTRTGPRTNENQIGGPDDGIVLFDEDDAYVSNVFVSTDVGFYRNYFKTPMCITSPAKPRQSPTVSLSSNFFVAMADPSVPIKVQSIQFFESEFGSSYEVELLDFSDTSKANDFLYRPGRFENPVDMTLTGDGSNYLFVVDEAKDSIYQFTTRGWEGVNPPPGSSESKNIIASFGGSGEGASQFNSPSAIAYLSEILYVCDKGNGRLLRFKLTTDIE